MTYATGFAVLPGISKHCTADGCTRTDTQTVDGVHGRRCDQHPPTFEPAHAVDLAVKLGPAAALAYCRTDLP